ncbi:MAG: hypothetical protein AAGJ31_16260, partial [Verrucomicrobiota bacterium]
PGAEAFDPSRSLPPERDAEVVLEADEAFLLPAHGDPVMRTFVIPCRTMGEAMKVGTVRLSLGDHEAVEHAVIRMDSTGYSQRLDEKDRLSGFAGRPHYPNVRQPESLFAVWTKWSRTQSAPGGTAWRVHPLADLVITCHLKPIGREAEIRPRIGLWESKDPDAKVLLTLRLANETIHIRPGTEDFSVRDRMSLPGKAHIHSVYPAGNRVARSFRLDLTGDDQGEGELPAIPRGQRDELDPGHARRIFEIEEWVPYEQELYRFARPVPVSKGTRLDLEIRYDSNLNRVRSLQPVRWGDRRKDEWGELYVQITVDDDWVHRQTVYAISRHQLALNIEGQEHQIENNLEAHRSLAVMYAELQQTEVAISHGKKAISMDPKDADSHAALGSAYFI